MKLGEEVRELEVDPVQWPAGRPEPAQPAPPAVPVEVERVGAA